MSSNVKVLVCAAVAAFALGVVGCGGGEKPAEGAPAPSGEAAPADAPAGDAAPADAPAGDAAPADTGAAPEAPAE